MASACYCVPIQGTCVQTHHGIRRARVTWILLGLHRHHLAAGCFTYLPLGQLLHPLDKHKPADALANAHNGLICFLLSVQTRMISGLVLDEQMRCCGYSQISNQHCAQASPSCQW